MAKSPDGDEKTAALSYRVPAWLKATLQKLADADRRQLSQYIRLVLEEHVEAMKAHEKDARGVRLRGAKGKR